jgi:hypothetical protein
LDAIINEDQNDLDELACISHREKATSKGWEKK